jgi:hypothetical protein
MRSDHFRFLLKPVSIGIQHKTMISGHVLGTGRKASLRFAAHMNGNLRAIAPSPSQRSSPGVVGDSLHPTSTAAIRTPDHHLRDFDGFLFGDLCMVFPFLSDLGPGV